MINSRWIRAGCSALLAPVLLALGGLARASTDDAKQIAYGRHLSQECTGCHSINGADTGIPSIIGWPADTLAATLKFYQTGARTNPVMVSVATSLNEKQVAALAAYFASLPKPAPKGKK
jgi:cytochrome c553